MTEKPWGSGGSWGDDGPWGAAPSEGLPQDAFANLTGASATSGVGTVVFKVIHHLAGIFSTSGVGTLAGDDQAIVQKVVVDIAATANVGEVTPRVTFADFSGVEANTGVGAPLPTTLSTLIGATANSTAGTFTKETYKELGNASTFAFAGNLVGVGVTRTPIGVQASGTVADISALQIKVSGGIIATSGIGSILPILDSNLIGVSAVSEAGDIIVSTYNDLIGVSSTCAVGSVTISFVVDRSGRIVYVAPELREISSDPDESLDDDTISFVGDRSGRIVYVAPELREIFSDPDDLLDDDSEAPQELRASSEDRVVSVNVEDRTVTVQ